MEKSNFRRGVGVVFLSLLVGCAQLNPDLSKLEQVDMLTGQSETISKVSPNSRANNILNFVIPAEVGETRTIKDAQESESILIIVGNFYHAASGRLCRRFTKETTKSDMRQRICNTQVACRNHEGDWYQVRQIVNVDHPKKSDLRCDHYSKTIN
jgi:hypothetical protein